MFNHKHKIMVISISHCDQWCNDHHDQCFMKTTSDGDQNVLSWSTTVMVNIRLNVAIERIFAMFDFFLALIHSQKELSDATDYVSNVPWDVPLWAASEWTSLAEWAHVRCTLITPSRNQPTTWINTIYYKTLIIWSELFPHYPLNPKLASHCSSNVK